MINIEDVQKMYDEVINNKKVNIERLRKADTAEQAILHYIELGNFDAADGAKIMKKLKEIIKKRRIIKAELQETMCIADRLKNAKIDKIDLKESGAYAKSLEEILAITI